MAATHALALTLGAGHRRVYTTAKLPRATIHFSRELKQIMDPEGQIIMKSSYELDYAPGQRAFVLALARPFVIYAMHFGEASQGSLFSDCYEFALVAAPCLRRFVRDLHLLLLLFKTSRLTRFWLYIGGFCSVSMVRERVRPRWGSAWDAHRAQRRRKKQLECALSLASSILRKKAREERRKLLDIIIEQKAEGSREGSISKLSNVRDAEPEVAPSTCIVEEDPTIGDLPCMEVPQAMKSSARALICDDYVPGCIIEEVPWTDDLPSLHAEKTMGNEIREEKSKVAADSGVEMDPGTAPSSGSSGGLHGFLLSDEHLALVFELRSHLADVELRTLLMNQRLDILLDAFSGAPAQHKCPLCAQEFAIPARYAWQASDDDGAMGE
jgi:hypothetical protein